VFFSFSHPLPDIDAAGWGVPTYDDASEPARSPRSSLDGDSRRMSIDETQSPRRRSLDLSSVQALNADPPLR
jgi:hypothetical protein